MKPTSFETAIRLQFDTLVKRVIDCTVKNYEKELDRRSRREVLFCELPEIKRNVLLLSYFEELSNQAIAELMDATRNGIYKRRQSALQLMRELLQEEE